MKNVCQLIGAIGLVLCIFSPAASQQPGKMQVGLAADFGQDFFKIKNESFIYNNSVTESRSSALALGGGIWLEKFVAKRLSILPQIDYHFIRVNDHVTIVNILTIPGPIKESYHSLVLGVNTRYYLPLGDGFRLFANAGVKADKMLIFRFQQNQFILTNSMPVYYGFINPGLTGGLGLSKGRWGLYVNYQKYFARSNSKIINSDTNILLEKRSISRQNAMIRLTYAIWQVKN